MSRQGRGCPTKETQSGRGAEFQRFVKSWHILPLLVLESLYCKMMPYEQLLMLDKAGKTRDVFPPAGTSMDIACPSRHSIQH